MHRFAYCWMGEKCPLRCTRAIFNPSKAASVGGLFISSPSYTYHAADSAVSRPHVHLALQWTSWRGKVLKGGIVEPPDLRQTIPKYGILSQRFDMFECAKTPNLKAVLETWLL
jgi:hypothetical protein